MQGRPTGHTTPRGDGSPFRAPLPFVIAALGALSSPTGSLASPPLSADADPTVVPARTVRHAGLLDTRLIVERSLVPASDLATRRSYERAAARLHTLRSSAAANLAHTLPHETDVSQLVAQTLDALRVRRVRVMRGGHNDLLSQVFASRRPHPSGASSEDASSTFGPRAFWIDCDLIAVSVASVLEELGERRRLDLLSRLAMVATTDHLALAIRGDSSDDAVEVVLLEVLDREGHVAIELVPLSRYRDSYRRRFGESPRLLEPHDAVQANAWEIAASHLISEQRWAEARHYAARALAVDPASPGAWNSLALAQRRTGETDAALDSLTRAIALRSRDPLLFSNLASVYMALDEPARAWRAAESAVVHGPGEPLAFKRRFAALSHLGEPARARRDLSRYQALLGQRAAVAAAAEP